MKSLHTLTIGIAPYEVLKERTLQIARGIYKPKSNEPKVWFSSLESLAQVLSARNKLLLEIIAQTRPQSLTELSLLSGRHKSNLSRTLKKMEQYGLIHLKRQKTGEILPEVTFNRLRVEVKIDRHLSSV